MILNELISSWQESHSMSLRVLARRIGIGHTTLYRFLQDKKISSTALAHVCRWILLDGYKKILGPRRIKKIRK